MEEEIAPYDMCSQTDGFMLLFQADLFTSKSKASALNGCLIDSAFLSRPKFVIDIAVRVGTSRFVLLTTFTNTHL